MQEIAKSRGGKCLSKRYLDAHTPLLWQCKNGHKWKAAPYTIKQDHWCSRCYHKKQGISQRLTIEEMRAIAKERDGKCLSKRYTIHTKLKWQCKKGHIWETTSHEIKSGYWCPICGHIQAASKRKLTIEEMQEIAKSRGGLCLSKGYNGRKTKLRWRCRKGHEWNADPISVKHGCWCPECAGKKKHTIEEMQELAKGQGGKCLSSIYVNNKTPLKWQCKEGHRWETIPEGIIKGAWCPKCAGVQRLSLEEMQEIAKARGGECLSKKYTNVDTQLKWKCKEGHIWKAIPNNVKKGAWCPVCSQGVSERICRKYFETIFGKKFQKTRPNWLRGTKNHKLELDGYCEELKLAFEYQGVQHYDKVTFFHTKKAFEQRKKDDEIKKKTCASRGIALILVPYTLEPDKMGEYIVDQCRKKGIHIPHSIKIPNYKQFDIYSPELLKEMQQVAKERGGKCLSKKYIDSNTKLLWLCMVGHKWHATPAHIKSGKWCPHCWALRRGKAKLLTIEEMQKIAKERGGKCLSKRYVNSNTKLEWQCGARHIWPAIPLHIKGGHWCPICGRQKTGDILRSNIGEMQRVAKERGGKCLSAVYTNSVTKLEWQCKKGHIWTATPSGIGGGAWCPKCAHAKIGFSQRLTIEEMQKIAKKRGGKCLSSVYTNSETKLKWQCKEGHIWEATPGSVKSGSWCQMCYHINVGIAQRLSIEDVQKIAEKRGGKCLSSVYTNSETKLKWQCKEGHIWEAKPNSVQQGRWCSQCAGTKKHTIEEMQEIAKEKGGRCLSETYRGNKVKLTWECSAGHKWEAKPNSIMSGSWCPICTKNRRKKTF